MTSSPYYRFFPGDYARDTSDLSMIEDAAYRRLLDYYYCDQKLPSDPQRLQRIARAGTSEEKAAVEYVAQRFFRVEGERLVNKRAEDEIEQRRAFLESQSQKGKQSGKIRRFNRGLTGVEPGLNRGSIPVARGFEPTTNLPVPVRSDGPSDATLPPPPNATSDPGGGIEDGESVLKTRRLKSSSNGSMGNGNGSGKRYLNFIEGLSPKKKEAVERAKEKALSGEWPARACRRHLLDEGFEDRRSGRSELKRAQKFIVYPKGM